MFGKSTCSSVVLCSKRVCITAIMSIRVSGVYLVASPGQPSSPEKSDSPGSGGVMAVKPTSVTIVTPQRSNSLDYLNFEEKRQIIASSLSLSDFLHHGPAAAAAAAKGVAATKVIVGKFKVWGVESNSCCPRVNLKSELTVRGSSRVTVILTQKALLMLCNRIYRGHDHVPRDENYTNVILLFSLVTRVLKLSDDSRGITRVCCILLFLYSAFRQKNCYLLSKRKRIVKKILIKL